MGIRCIAYSENMFMFYFGSAEFPNLNNQFDFYFSLSDVSAAQNIGSVLAQRCLEAGITNVFLDDQSDEQMPEKVYYFDMSCRNFTQQT
jgi:hypothetical protein